MDRLRSMQVFVEVARDGSFTGAARRLGMSKASVTKHIAALETALRARLLHRTTKQVGLTDAGFNTLRSARALLERYEDIETEARGSTRQAKGMVRVGSPPSFGAHHLAPLLTQFASMHPDIQMSLMLDDGSVNLITQGLDLSVRIGSAPEDASYVAQPLTKAPQVVVASPSYIAKHGRPQTPADLARHNCLNHTLKSPTGIWRFQGPGGQSSSRVRGTISSNFGEVIKHAAMLGHGIALHPYYVVAGDIAAGRLLPLLPQYEPQGLDIYLIYSSRQNLPLRVRKFVDFLKDWAANPPAWSKPGSGPGTKKPRRR